MFEDVSPMEFPELGINCWGPCNPNMFSRENVRDPRMHITTLPHRIIDVLSMVDDRLCSVVYDQSVLTAVILPSFHRESIACTHIRVWLLDLITMQRSISSHADNHNNSFQSVGTRSFINQLPRLSSASAFQQGETSSSTTTLTPFNLSKDAGSTSLFTPLISSLSKSCHGCINTGRSLSLNASSIGST